MIYTIRCFNERIKLTHLLSKEVGHEEEKQFGFSSFWCLLFPIHKRKSMFAVLHSYINSLKSGLLHLTGQPYCKKSRSVKVKDGIWTYFIGTISLIDTRINTVAKFALSKLFFLILFFSLWGGRHIERWNLTLHLIKSYMRGGINETS